MARGVEKPLALLEAVLDAAREKPGAPASIAAAVSVLGAIVLLGVTRQTVRKPTFVMYCVTADVYVE